MATIADPTPVAAPSKAKDRRFKWGEFLFQTSSTVPIRPATTASETTEIETNVKTYRSSTPKDTYEDMTLNVIYNADIWDDLDAARKAGTVNTFETDDGFSHKAMISQLGEVSADINGAYDALPITFSFVDDETTVAPGS